MCRTSSQQQCYQRKLKQNDIEKKTTTEIRWNKNKKSSHDRSLRIRPIIYFIGKCQVILSLFGSSLLGFIHICNAMIHLLKVVRRFFTVLLQFISIIFITILFGSKNSIVCFLFLSFLHSLCKLLSISFYYFDQFYIHLCRWKLRLRFNFGAYQRKQQTTTTTTNRKLLQASIRANKTGHFIWVASDRYFN